MDLGLTPFRCEKLEEFTNPPEDKHFVKAEYLQVCEKR